jgi:molybdenum cofactor biosynthesis enzyme MoaA
MGITKINKNRKREKFSFANINLLGTCNANCYFCLGKDIAKELKGKNQLDTHFSKWKNFDKFIEMCKQEGIKKLYLTGQTADGLQYRYLREIIDYLQENDFVVGVRTNGRLALQKMECINAMKDEIAYSIHTLKPEVNEKIMGFRTIPDWDKIIPLSGDNVRISIVLCRYNIDEFDELIRYISKFDNVRYIQIRRISTDTRFDLLKEDIELYEQFYQKFANEHTKDRISDFYLAQRYMLYGKELNFWRTVETSVNSLNYFTDGTCSDEYFIVEGYLKNN